MRGPELIDALGSLARNGLGAPVFLVVILMMVVVPLPTFLLDLFFTFNITLSLVILLAAVYTHRPLDFAVFPTLLLITTLMRLALNVASTRVVLLEGHTGAGAAGRVIEAFGSFVVGGNYTVGLVVFIILVIINFVVVTKGAGRVSEVSARFTLDALPGKQMAIDADLNAGVLTQEEARERRREVVAEADYYGAMDGASKFVRGDAIAGLLILCINIIGGFAIGTAQHSLEFADALEKYTLLTIGDGLVAQIPSLLLSTAAAIMVTRSSKEGELGDQIIDQLFRNHRILWTTAAVVGLLGIIPGMPNLVFLLLAGATAYLALRQWKQSKDSQAAAALSPGQAEERSPEQEREIDWQDVPVVDAVGMEVGYRLIPLVDRAQDGQLLGRIKGVRKKLSRELGFLIPPVHIRDNLDLAPSAYRIALHGVTVAEAAVFPDRELAINAGDVYGNVEGSECEDPVFNLPAVWIEPARREQAQTLGYSVVDTPTVVATHLNQVFIKYAHELFGHQEAQELLDRLGKMAPKLAQDLVPNTLPLRVVVKVLQNLLVEQVPVRDMRTIAEALTQHGAETQDPGVLTAHVRSALKRLIIQGIYGLKDELTVLTLDGQLEQILLKSNQLSAEGDMVVEPGLAQRLQKSMSESAEKQEIAGEPAVLLVSDTIRAALARFASASAPPLHVLAFGEIPEDKKVRVIATVGV